jgi:hypothetical protein
LNSSSKFKGVAFGSIENRQFPVKTDQNSIFLGRKAHILDWLHIMFLQVLNFYQILAQNSKVASILPKMPVCGKN